MLLVRRDEQRKDMGEKVDYIRGLKLSFSFSTRYGSRYKGKGKFVVGDDDIDIHC